LKGIFEMF